MLKETEKAANSDLMSSGASSATEEETKEDIMKKEEEILAKSKETSLLLQHSQLKKLADAKQVSQSHVSFTLSDILMMSKNTAQESEMEKQLKEEEKILESVKAQTALMGAEELAKGIKYEDPIRTSWKVPR